MAGVEQEYVISRVVDHGFVDGKLVLRVHWYESPESEETREPITGIPAKPCDPLLSTHGSESFTGQSE